MDIDDILTRVKRGFGDESAVQVTDADILRWINDAQRAAVLHNAELLQTVTTLDIVKEQAEYSFPSDLLILRTVRVKMPQMESFQYVEPLNLSEFDKLIDGWDGTRLGSSNIVYAFTTYARSIFLFPTPDKAATGGLKILYSKRPEAVATAQDELSLPEEYHNAIVTYCMSQANTLDEDYEASAIHDAKFLGDVRSASFQNQRGARETYPTITVLEEDAW